MMVSIYNLVYIAVERWLAVLHPIYYKGNVTDNIQNVTYNLSNITNNSRSITINNSIDIINVNYQHYQQFW